MQRLFSHWNLLLKNTVGGTCQFKISISYARDYRKKKLYGRLNPLCSCFESVKIEPLFWIKNRKTAGDFSVVGDGGFDLHFCPKGKNYGSHQCLHWWQQLSTGQLHCYGFKSTSKQKRDTPKGVSLFWWGRTDSNHRSDTQQIYSLSPLATRELPHMKFSV